MSVLNRSTLVTNNDSKITSNGSNAITGTILHDHLGDLIDSVLLTGETYSSSQIDSLFTSYYNKTQSDAIYSSTGFSYSKAVSDGKYVSFSGLTSKSIPVIYNNSIVTSLNLQYDPTTFSTNIGSSESLNELNSTYSFYLGSNDGSFTNSQKCTSINSGYIDYIGSTNSSSINCLTSNINISSAIGTFASTSIDVDYSNYCAIVGSNQPTLSGYYDGDAEEQYGPEYCAIIGGSTNTIKAKSGGNASSCVTVGGFNLIISGASYMVATGKYNQDTGSGGTTLFVIGDGTGSTYRHDAFVVKTTELNINTAIKVNGSTGLSGTVSGLTFVNGILTAGF